jgi:hypothetical protein
MLQLGKILHVLAVGLWFGSAVFFTYMGVNVFGTFEQITAEPAPGRPAWLPESPLYDQPRPSRRLPDPLRKEQGARIAGAVVGQLFPVYFGLQVACGAVVALTAFGWRRLSGSASSLRIPVTLAALICVVIGWGLERKVSELRGPRDAKTDELLAQSEPSDVQITETEAARRTFVQWHLASVLLNLVTLALVTVAMGLVAWLPAHAVQEAGHRDASSQSANGSSVPESISPLSAG